MVNICQQLSTKLALDFGHQNGDISGMKNHIRELREALGITQEQLADRVGTTNQTISRLELGERKLSQQWMERLGKALGVKASVIIDDGSGAVPAAPQPRGYVVNDPEEMAWVRLYQEMTPRERHFCLKLIGRGLVGSDVG